MGQPGSIPGTKGWRGLVRAHLGIDASTGAAMRSSYRTRGFAKTVGAFFGFGGDAGALMPSGMNPFTGRGFLPGGNLERFPGLEMTSANVRVPRSSGGIVTSTAAYRQARFGRRAAGVGLGLAASAGIYAATGRGIFDQAQAGAGGYMGYKYGRSVGGKWGGVVGAAAGGFGGQALGGWSWALGGAGYGAARAAQFIAGPKGSILERARFGGGIARVGAAAAGIGIGMLL